MTVMMKRRFTPLDPVFLVVIQLALGTPVPIPSYNNNNNNYHNNDDPNLEMDDYYSQQLTNKQNNLNNNNNNNQQTLFGSNLTLADFPFHGTGFGLSRNNNSTTSQELTVQQKRLRSGRTGENKVIHQTESSKLGDAQVLFEITNKSKTVSTIATATSIPSSSESSETEFDSLTNSIVKIKSNTNSNVSLKSVGRDKENCTLEPAFLCLMDLVQFQRDRDLRLQAIKAYVMQKLGIIPKVSSRPSPVDRPAFLEQINPSSAFSGQLQTLYASCDVPANVDKETWNSPDFFHIYFNLPPSITSSVSTSSRTTPTNDQLVSDENRAEEEEEESVRAFNAMIRASTQQQNGRINLGDLDSSSIFTNLNQKRRASQERRDTNTKNFNVISAKLKLYKIGRRETDEFPQSDESVNKESAEPCNETTITTTEESLNPVLPILNTQKEEPNEEKIRVSVYWYIHPIKKHHFKKKLLDTKMLSVKETKWVEFDIQKAVVAWLERRENFGLLVQVENEDNDWVAARKYFNGLPCAAVRDAQKNVQNSSRAEVVDIPAIVEVLPPPVLEICTLSVPSPSSSVQAASVSGISGILRQASFPSSGTNHHQNQRQTHRHRHNHGENRAHRSSSSNHRNGNGNSHNNHRQRNQMSIETSQLPVYSNFNRTQQNFGETLSNTDENTNSNRSNRFSSSSNNNSDQNENTEVEFKLDEDHPLREIFATVSSSGSSSVSSTVKTSPSLDQDLNYNDEYNGGDEATDIDDERDIIVQKIYISPPTSSSSSPTSSRRHHHHHHHNHSNSSSNSRVNSNLNR